jgi:hypothetical protein
MSTFLTAYGLMRCGYEQAAVDVAGRLVDVLVADAQQNGTTHEYYHAETGAPIMKPGFLSWNLLALRVLGDIADRTDPAAVPAAGSTPTSPS